MTGPRIALVGAGAMGSLHARVLAGSPRCSLAVVVDPAPDARVVARRYDVPWAPALDLTGVDAVVLAAPTPAHYPLALDVLSADVPLLVEKPVCDDLARTHDVVRLAETRDVPLMCGLLERFNPGVLTAAALVSSPVHVSAVRHSPYAPRIRTGVGWDLLVHDVDIAIRCFGAAPHRVAGSRGHFHPTSDTGAEDVLDVLLEFPCGGLASASARRIGQRKVRALTIFEVDRLVEVDLLRRDVTIYRHVSNDAPPDGLGYRQQTVIEIPEPVSTREPLAAQLDRFLDVVEGTVDAAEERRSILPAHEVVAAALK